MAGNRVINTILRLRDQMSGGLIRAVRNTRGVSREMVNATRRVVAFKNRAVSAVKSVATNIGRLGITAAGAVAALAAKTGLSEAMDLEGYRLQLETATKDTKKAAAIMVYAIELANKTPFEGGQLVEAAAKFEAMGMSAQTWLSRAGDMAAATNKDFDQATEALIDAQNGELERLKEFGITKEKILQQGEKLFAGTQIANNQGQIVNQEKFNEALVSLMNDRFAGGMEKQASTTKGILSTVTGIWKSSLAKIAGVSEDGSIRAGSALALIKEKVNLLATKLQEWQADGTIDSLAEKFTSGLGWAVEKAGQAFNWVRDHGDQIVKVLKDLGTAFAVVKIIQFANGVVQAVGTFASFAKAVGLFVMQNPIVLAFAAAIAAGIWIWQNWDWLKAGAIALWEKIKTAFGGIRDGIVNAFTAVKESALGVWENIKSTFGGIRDSITGAFDAAKQKVGEFFTWIGDSLGRLNKTIEGIPIIGDLYKGLKSGGAALWSGIKSAGSWVGNKLTGNALGTSYWRGGLTRVNERGGEIMNLPNGTQIIPHDVSQRMAGGRSITVNVTVQGNVIGNRQYLDEMGSLFAQKVLLALGNT